MSANRSEDSQLAPLVSVIMPVYNGDRYLSEAIDSILAQTFTDFELLIVDDASTDSSAEIVRSYEKRDSRIRFFQLTENSGAATARNCALNAAVGAYVTPMDCDDVSVETRLQQQVSFLNANPEIGAVGGCGQAVSGDLATLLFRQESPPSHAVSVLNMFCGDGFVQASVMFRRKFLIAVGGYDPGLRISEDLDLILRLLFETGIKFANLQEDLLIFRRHAGSTTMRQRQEAVAVSRELRQRALERLWNRPMQTDTLDRFMALRRLEKLGWKDRRAAKQDLRRLIDALIAHGWVEPADKPLLVDAMNRRLELASPRRWQQFMHWRRHRLRF